VTPTCSLEKTRTWALRNCLIGVFDEKDEFYQLKTLHQLKGGANKLRARSKNQRQADELRNDRLLSFVNTLKCNGKVTAPNSSLITHH
jgi:hypothetical protein